MDQEGDTSLYPEPSGEGTSEPTTAMDVSEDEADEALLKLNEDELRNLQKANSIQCIEGMRLSPKEQGCHADVFGRTDGRWPRGRP
jgi:hypothetical protein